MNTFIPFGKMIVMAGVLFSLALGQPTFAQDNFTQLTGQDTILGGQVISRIPKQPDCNAAITIPLEIISPERGTVIAHSLNRTHISGLTLLVDLPLGQYHVTVQKPNQDLILARNVLDTSATGIVATVDLFSTVEDWRDSGTYLISVIPVYVPAGSRCIKGQASMEVEMNKLEKSGWRSIRRK